MAAKQRCWHWWRYRHRYVYGMHCDKCCKRFKLPK